MKEVLQITIQEVGTTSGYEDYHNEYYLDGALIGTSSYDKGPMLHVGSLKGKLRDKHPKNFYAKSPTGLAWKMQKAIL